MLSKTFIYDILASIQRKVVRRMKHYEILMAKELFAGSDIIRKYTYKMATLQDNYALFQETDCFVCTHLMMQ